MLVEVSSGSGTARHPIRAEAMTLGRSGDNDIVISNEDTVSRHHAELFVSSPGSSEWNVRDLDSNNGTHVNGVRLAGGASSAVTSRDVIGLGAVTLRLVDDVEVDAQTVDDQGGGDLHRLLTVLSEREREVLAMVATGRTDQQCAHDLFISVKTVHSHLDRIRSKTGLRRRAELTRLAVRLGLSSNP